MLNNLELYCILTFEAWPKINMHFDCRNLELLNILGQKRNAAMYEFLNFTGYVFHSKSMQ